MKFVASRLSDGNKLFPAEIIIEPNGLTVKIPGLFSGHSRHLDFQQIGEVSVDTPLVGYSTISFYTAGTRASAHGFTKDEVRQIKAAIERGKNNNFRDDDFEDDKQSAEEMIAEAQAEQISYELDRKRKLDNFSKPWLNDSNFKSKDAINQISYPSEIDDVEKTIEKIIKAGTNEVKNVLALSSWTPSTNSSSFFKPYADELEMVEACIEKSQEGLKKLKRWEHTDNSKLKHIIADLDEGVTDLKEKWLPKLQDKIRKKKKTNLMAIGILILAFLACCIGYNFT